MNLRLDFDDIAFVETLIKGCGIDCASLLSELGLRRDLFNAPGTNQITFADYVQILRYLVEVSGDETCTGSARQILIGTTPFLLGGVSRNLPMREALRRLADGYNFAHGGIYNHVRLSRNRLVYIINDTDFPYSHSDFSRDRHAFIESILISLHGLFCKLADRPLSDRVLRITTRRRPSDSGGSFLKFWHAPIQMSADYYSIEYDGRIADWPVTPIDEVAYLSIFDAAADAWAGELREASGVDHWTRKISQVITSGVTNQSTVAASLGLSPATMRRRLAYEGVQFRALRAQVLNARARRLLALKEPAHRVAATLGFSDLRSFSRAFKAWNLITPTAYQAETEAARE